MSSLHYFHICPPHSETSFTWIGGPLLKSATPGKAYLTKPNGQPVAEVALSAVRVITRNQLARLLQQDLAAQRAPHN